MTFKYALALMLASVSAPSFAGISTTKVPVEMNVSPEQLNDLPPERRRAIEALSADVRAHLWRWDDVRVDLPESAFGEGAVIVRQSDLFRLPDAGELRELTTVNGERIPLSEANLQTIRDEGLIVVPSVRYPGHNHVWRIHRFWQKGRDNVNVTFDFAKGEALNQVSVQIPNRLKPGGQRPNLFRGGENIVEGLKDSIATVIGVIEKVPRYTDDQVTDLLRKEAEDFVARGAGPALDLRLYDKELMKEVRPKISAILERVDKAWPRRQEELLAAQLPVFRAQGLTDAALATAAREWLAERRVETFHEALNKSVALENLSPGIATLLVNRDRAVRLTAAAVATYHADVDRERTNRISAYRAEHRVKKYVFEFVARAVEPEVEAYRAERWAQATTKLAADLHDAGLDQERELALLSLAYQSQHADVSRAAYAEDLVPLRTLPVHVQIWNSEDWIKRETDVRGKKVYHAETTRTHEVSSNVPFWRLAAIGVRTYEAFINQNYHLTQALQTATKTTFGREDFYAKEMMNAETGEIEPDPRSKTGTWVTRQRAIHEAWDAANARFENEAEGDVIPKRVLRPAVKLRNGVLAATATAGLAAVQVGGFVCTSVFSCVGIAASPLTSPAYGLVRWAGDALFYDGADYARRPGLVESRTAPLVWSGLTTLGGAGESVVSAAAVPLHLVAGGALYAGGAVQYGVRSAWDAFWFSVIKKFNLPTRDKGVVTERIQGPGLEKNVVFLIEPALALTALRAYHEAEELRALLDRTLETLREPAAAAAEQIAAYRAIGWQPNHAWFDSIQKSSDRLARRVTDQINGRIRDLPVVNGTRVAVRLAEDDLEPTLLAGEKLTKDFWEGRGEKIDWHSMSLSSGDYRGLTERAFAKIFGQGFFARTAPGDDSLVFAQSTPDFARAFDDLLNDRPLRPEDVALESPDRVLARELAPNVDPRTRESLAWTLDSSCERLLLNH